MQKKKFLRDLLNSLNAKVAITGLYMMTTLAFNELMYQQ